MEKCIRHKKSVSFSVQHLLRTLFATMNELFSESRSRCGTKSHLGLHVNSRLFLSKFSTNSHMSTKFSNFDKEKCGNLLTISRIVHSEHKGSHSDTNNSIFANGPKPEDSLEVRRCSSRHSGRHINLIFSFERFHTEK